ncbi:hypothetical protein EDB80DRAFT_700260 [Ilyonectria destructans]|nr:hypothetical protein EDB80DRAFT_700260 [Ilyonectria destructans]
MSLSSIYLFVFSHSDGSIPKFTLPFFDACAHVVDPYTIESRVPYSNITPDANHSPINDAAVIFRLHGTRFQNIPSWMFRQQQITTLNQPRIIHSCPRHFVFVKPKNAVPVTKTTYLYFESNGRSCSNHGSTMSPVEPLLELVPDVTLMDFLATLTSFQIPKETAASRMKRMMMMMAITSFFFMIAVVRGLP